MSEGWECETWEAAVLRIIRSHKEGISIQEIYKAMENHPLVTAYHRELWGNQPNFHLWIRSALDKLKQQGDVRHVDRALFVSN
jgi:hypothetical protein